jgi:hypothetical protein
LIAYAVDRAALSPGGVQQCQVQLQLVQQQWLLLVLLGQALLPVLLLVPLYVPLLRLLLELLL